MDIGQHEQKGAQRQPASPDRTRFERPCCEMTHPAPGQQAERHGEDEHPVGGRDRRIRASERGDRRAEQRDVAETARSPESLRVALVLGPGTGELGDDLLRIACDIDEVGGLGEALGLIEVDRRVPVHVRERCARQRDEQHREPDRQPEYAGPARHPGRAPHPTRSPRPRPAGKLDGDSCGCVVRVAGGAQSAASTCWMISACASSMPSHRGSLTRRSAMSSVTLSSPWARPKRRPAGASCSGM
jgi:hypothetical protein